MNVTITEDPRLADIEVAVSCPRIDERVQRIVAGLNAFERKLTGERDGATYRLDIDGICYVETVDGRTFLYLSLIHICACLLPVLALCAWLGQWLPAEDPGAWASFVVIYLFILAGMTAGYTVYYKKTAGGYDEALARYREQNRR